MARILLTGNITLDVIADIDQFPREDSESRATSIRRSVGGNAANSAKILIQMRQDTHLCGVLADDADGTSIRHQLGSMGITLTPCLELGGTTPCSVVLVSQQSGTRTIVHHRQLDEMQHDHFARLPLEIYDWFHFEARNPLELEKMLRETTSRRFDQPISLEMEKPREGLCGKAVMLADVLLFSSQFAIASGFSEPASFLEHLKAHYPKKFLTLTWGNQGAWCINNRGDLTHCPASPTLSIVDSLGAGDCFNAGIINALVSGNPIEEALHKATALVEAKLRQIGFDNLI